MNLLHALILGLMNGSGGGGSELFVVTVTESNGVYSADKTLHQILDAYDAGKIVCALLEENIFPLITYEKYTEALFSICITNDTIALRCENDGNADSWSYELVELSVEPASIAVTGATPTITPAANNIYNCGELTSLTISSPPATGAYSIVFTSGSTATTTTIPATVKGLESFAAAKNTIYEINVLNNRAVVGSWPVSSS